MSTIELQAALEQTTTRRKPRRAAVAVAVVAVVVLVLVAVAPTPYDPNDQLIDGLNATGLPIGPTLSHPFGTDTLGRDELSRVIAGARVSLLIGVLGSFFATTLGVAIGLAAGYFRGWIGGVLMRFTDVMMAFPYLLLAVALQAIIGAGVGNVLLVVAAVTWVNAARVMNGLALAESSKDYVSALEVLGVRRLRMVTRHLLPNLSVPVIVLFTTGVGYTILLEATLSYLGLGVQPPEATWGNMMREGQAYFQSASWLVVAPGAAIVLSVVVFSFIGDQLGDRRRTR